jgi:hypothetical protein
VHLLVQRVSVSPERIAVDLRTEGLGSVIREMTTPRIDRRGLAASAGTERGSRSARGEARIAHLLVQRVSVSPERIAVDLRTEGLGSVIREMTTPRIEEALA